MERPSEQNIEYWYVEQNEYETHHDEVIFDQSHDQINLQMIEIEQESPAENQPKGSGAKRNESWGRPGRKAAVPDEDLDEKALKRRNRRRLRNREAAQRQRDRRVTQLNQLQESNKSLLEENEKLKENMKKMDEKYKRALFKIQSMQKLMTNCHKCASPKEPSPLGILNGATKQSRKRPGSSIELPIVKMTLKASQPPTNNNPQKMAPESPTPEKTINKYIQYLKTGPFETLNSSTPCLKPNLSSAMPSSEPPMKKTKLTNSDFNFQEVFADVFFKKPVEITETVDITKTAMATEGAISNHSSVHKFC